MAAVVSVADLACWFSIAGENPDEAGGAMPRSVIRCRTLASGLLLEGVGDLLADLEASGLEFPGDLLSPPGADQAQHKFAAYPAPTSGTRRSRIGEPP